MTQTIINLGTGGAVLNGQNGSTTSADSSDALFLDWPGDNAGNYVYLPGVAGNNLAVPDEAALDITGDIDVRVQVAMDDWTPAAFNCLMNKGFNSATDRSWDFYLDTTGVIGFAFSANGSTNVANVSSSVAVTATDGQLLWLRATLDVDNGAGGNDIKFFTSTDGVTWTQLGVTRTTAGTSSIYNSSLPLNIGQRVSGTGGNTAGKVYRAQVLNGIDGTKVLDVDTSLITTGAATTFTAVTGQTVTINRSTTGKKSVAVCQPTWLFGTNSFMEVANNDLLNFDAADQFSVVYAYRVWATPGSFTSLFNKRLNNSDSFDAARIGYGARIIGTSQQFFQVNSETHYSTASRTGLSAGFRVGVMRYNNKDMKHLLAGTEATATLGGGTSLRNSLPFRIGANSGVFAGEFGEFEFYALALFRRELTNVERDAMVTYWTNRIK